MSEVFDLDRDTNIKNNIDSTGKKWTIYKDRTNHMLYTRPEGGRADSIIPDKMQGSWTKRHLLEEQIQLHVVESWDKADALKAKAERKQQAIKEHKNGRKATEEEVEEARTRQEADTGEDLGESGRTEHTGSKEEKEESKEEEAVSHFEGMDYQTLVMLAKEQGITARKKADIIAALEG